MGGQPFFVSIDPRKVAGSRQMSQLPTQPSSAHPKLEKAALRGIRTGFWTILVSLGLGIVKVFAGVVGHSYALVADGVESMFDVVSGLLVVGSLKLAAHPPDEKFPFGYGRVEPTVALAIAAGLVATAVVIAIQSVREILAPHLAPAPFTLVVLILVIVVKEIMFRILSRTGKSIFSSAMEADAWHHRSDSITSLAALVGISIALWGGPGYEPADDWAALFAAAVIAYNGCRLLIDAIRDIMDVALPEGVVEDIRGTAASVAGVSGIDMCRVRKSGLGLWVDIHVEVPGNKTVHEGHEIAHRVKDALLASSHNVMDAIVHIEPART
jgi:cation diffusion facilitator family transporter